MKQCYMRFPGGKKKAFTISPIITTTTQNQNFLNFSVQRDRANFVFKGRSRIFHHNFFGKSISLPAGTIQSARIIKHFLHKKIIARKKNVKN